MLAPLLVPLLLSPAPVEAAPATEAEAAAPEPSTGVRLERGYLRVQGHDRAALVEALVLRVPHLAFDPFEAATPTAETSMAFVDVRREPDGPDADAVVFAVTIVVSDGRAFDRQVPTPRGDDGATRLLASTIANLLLAIEAGTVEPDRGDVPLPTEMAPACPACECPAPPQCPAESAPVSTPEPEPPEPETPAVSPRIEIGPVVAISSVLGLGPPQQADRFAAAGATLGVHARLRRGAFFGAEARGAGRSSALGVSVGRLRVALGAGYRWRRGAWSLAGSVWATAEPWWARGGELEPRPAALWGLALRLSPALHQHGLANGRLALSVGPTIELAASGSFTEEGPATALLTVSEDHVDQGYLRAGGVELATGLAMTLWFGLGPRD